MAKKENIASVLAFEKKLVTSDGYMYGTSWDTRSQIIPLELIEKAVRGTISHRFKTKEKAAFEKNPAKLDQKVEVPNLQTVDSCSLGINQDTLNLQFTIKVLGGITQPSACNDALFKQSYSAAADDYIATQAFTELARRYASNIANARFLWRNRVGAEKIEVQVVAKNSSVNESYTFDAKQFSTRNFDFNDEQIDQLAAHIASTLASEDNFLLLDINCFVQVGKLQEVYPSEELVLNKNSSNKEKKAKILYHVKDIAAMHSQKIGNALRTIDTWYPEFTDPKKSAGPIAIEPYGAVTNLGKAYRKLDNQDFYSFFDIWAQGGKLSRVEDEHYVMATLVRGGVFGESDEKEG
jgi:CRISPR-associated protein Csy3